LPHPGRRRPHAGQLRRTPVGRGLSHPDWRRPHAGQLRRSPGGRRLSHPGRRRPHAGQLPQAAQLSNPGGRPQGLAHTIQVTRLAIVRGRPAAPSSAGTQSPSRQQCPIGDRECAVSRRQDGRSGPWPTRRRHVLCVLTPADAQRRQAGRQGGGENRTARDPKVRGHPPDASSAAMPRFSPMRYSSEAVDTSRSLASRPGSAADQVSVSAEKIVSPAMPHGTRAGRLRIASQVI